MKWFYYNETDFMSMTAQNKDYGMGNPNTPPSPKENKKKKNALRL